MDAKRKFTTPLGSGRAPSLGANDPRARRDAAARAESVSSGKGEVDPEIAALRAEVATLRAQLKETQAGLSELT